MQARMWCAKFMGDGGGIQWSYHSNQRKKLRRAVTGQSTEPELSSSADGDRPARGTRSAAFTPDRHASTRPAMRRPGNTARSCIVTARTTCRHPASGRALTGPAGWRRARLTRCRRAGHSARDATQRRINRNGTALGCRARPRTRQINAEGVD